MSKRPPVTPQAARVAVEPLGAGNDATGTRDGLSAAQRRLWLLTFRSGQRAERRREVRSEIRAAYWAHRSGERVAVIGSAGREQGLRPPTQAVLAPGRYLSDFVWDEERRRWSCPGEPLRKSPEQAQLEMAA